jgi:hypothetical protein
MTPKETLTRMFAKLDPPTTDLAINLAIGQGFSDDEILAMRPVCETCERSPADQWSNSRWDQNLREFVPTATCNWCSLPF